MTTYHIVVWNEEVERGYTIIAETASEAKQRVIKSELEIYRVPLYKIHIEQVERYY